MQRNQKIIVTVVWTVTIIVVLSMVGSAIWVRRSAARAAGDQPAQDVAPGELPVYYSAPAFSLTDQAGATVTDGSLRGNVWVTTVFFSRCPGVCPMMTSRLSAVQTQVPRSDLKFVCFSIDPEHDTPPVMKEYAGRFGLDQARWHFLTGPKDRMFEIARALALSATPGENGRPPTHTTKVLLLDRANRVRGIYDTTDDESMKKLAEDAGQLVASSEAGDAQ